MYDRTPYETKVRLYLGKIREFVKNGVPVSFPSDLFETLGVDITEKDYYDYLKEIGKKIETSN